MPSHSIDNRSKKKQSNEICIDVVNEQNNEYGSLYELNNKRIYVFMFSVESLKNTMWIC